MLHKNTRPMFGLKRTVYRAFTPIHLVNKAYGVVCVITPNYKFYNRI